MIRNEWDQADVNREAEKELKVMRYWQAFRHAIENYVTAVDANENGMLIHCLAKVVRLRETELDEAEKGIR